MSSFLLDTPLANVFRWLGTRKLFSFPEERDDYDLAIADEGWKRHCLSGRPDLESVRAHLCMNEPEGKYVMVDWYGATDPANPLNWPKRKKFVVYFIILYISVAVYMSGSIYSAAQSEVDEAFGVSATVSSLGLGLYVLGYGVGPMFWSPLSEIPAVGRNIPYLASLTLFVLISIPTALAPNIASLLVLRFLQGFFGSPVLTTGGASLGDVSSAYGKPYAFYSLALFSLGGPALGNTIAGYSIPVLGWRWSLWEVLLANGPGLVLLLFLPETSAANILYRRTQRIRILSLKEIYKFEPEMKAKNTTVVNRLHRALIVPWKLNVLDPSIAFTSIYCGLVYAIFYSFFEFFPLVYGNIYNMTLGEVGLIFLSVIVAVGLAGIPYCAFVHFVVNKSIKNDNPMTPEGRLLPSLFASVLIPVGILIFAWTSRSDIHWIVPTIGTMLVSGSVVMIIQSVFVYITLAYPRYTASLFSGNGLIRSSVAFAGVLWSHPLYDALGVNWGMTLMGGCCAICIIGIYVLYYFGHKLRARSKFTE
ncbi:major facilitator superfamily domain-containing protein [Aspergillus pseudotamarii]|uniref:Major facilitator superfamily domain-containing protein n=1 Tax=Aspergillus pseudotamarii TaxID=132259 RepID=A0A5N6SRA3_ASPPS|nr:major facilitator superfamily domain-containing protein [Aspergillus pseudotamarii]KAE8137115.1 major facilitator superfamily domain-containing protein [Aspergillus pseudotamarii]